jgi:hypothetical protein
VDGRKLFVDLTFMDADALNNPVLDMDPSRRCLDQGYGELVKRLEEKEEEEMSTGDVGRCYIFTTNLDVSIA